MKRLSIPLGLIALSTLLLGCASITHHASVSAAMSSDSLDSSAAWARLDKNGDGSLAFDELENQQAMGLLQDFGNADANGDGAVSRPEWDAWWPHMTNHHVRGSGLLVPAFGDTK